MNALLLLVIAATMAAATPRPAAQLGSQLQLPQPTGYVNDFAGVISPEAKQRLDGLIADVRAKSGGEIVVVTLPDLRGRAESDVARDIGRQWRVGRSGGPSDRARNTGVIILLAPKETSSDGRGHAFIAPGTGAEGFITDGTSGAIIDEALPLLRLAEYSDALELMTARVAERFAREFQFQLDSTRRVAAPGPQRARRPSVGININPIFIIILIVIIAQMFGGRRRRRRSGCIPIFIPMGGGGRGWGGGGFGGGGGGGFGGFGGFGGGGGFSGGGAGRSW